MELIPMTNYVIKENQSTLEKQTFDLNKNNTLLRKLADRIWNYARFLDQKLKLSMFVTCNEEGEIIDYPMKMDYGLDAPELNTYKHPIECYGGDLEDYRKAEKKVLFKGFEVEDGMLFFNGMLVELVDDLGSLSISYLAEMMDYENEKVELT